MLVQVALKVALVDAGRTCGVRVVPAGCPVAGAAADLVVPARITPLGPARWMLAGTGAGAVITVSSGRGGARQRTEGNAERWP